MKKKVLKIFQSFAQGAISSGGFFSNCRFFRGKCQELFEKMEFIVR